MGLAGESSRNDVNQSSILGAVEGTYIGPDGGVVDVAVLDPGFDDFLGILFPFDIAYCPHFQSSQLKPKVESTVAAEQTQLIHIV